jgi:hypothetical protein
MNTWLQTLHESTCGRNTGQDVVDTDASRECGAKKKGSMYQSATIRAKQTQPLLFFFFLFQWCSDEGCVGVLYRGRQ